MQGFVCTTDQVCKERKQNVYRSKDSTPSYVDTFYHNIMECSELDSLFVRRTKTSLKSTGS